MKYKTVRITSIKGKWTVSVTKDEKERIEKETIPNDMGFYTYPETVSDLLALKILVHSMINRHAKEIKLLEKSLDRLRKLI